MVAVKVPSAYQKAIYEWVREGTGHAAVVARAGSGKTTTIVNMTQLLSGRVLLLAFNKAIAMEMAQRLPSSRAKVMVKTINAMGHGIICRNMGPVEVDTRKLRRLARAVLPPSEYKFTAGPLIDLVRFARNSLTLPGPDYVQRLWAMVDRFEMDLCGETVENLLPYLLKILDMAEREMEDKQVIDFDEQIYWPVVKIQAGEWSAPNYDWVLVDEAQDTAAGNQALATSLLRPGRGRFVAVADPAQSIYAWRSADPEAMSELSRKLAEMGPAFAELPLSISYRCPLSHIRLAQEIVPSIEPFPENPEGTITKIGGSSLDASDDPIVAGARPNDLVICRRNAPLFKLYLQLIVSGKAVYFRGRDVGKQLISLVERVENTTLDDEAVPEERSDQFHSPIQDGTDYWPVLEPFDRKLRFYREREVQKLQIRELFSLAENLQDKCACLATLRTHLGSVAAMKKRLQEMFTDEAKTNAVQLSTIHRAKGLEADRVWIVDYSLLPTYFPNSGPARRQQERNCKYVAVTRSKRDLFLVG